MKKLFAVVSILVVLFTVVACDTKDENTLSLITPTAQNNLDIIAPLFEADTGIKLEAISKATGDVVTELNSTKDNPIYDVVWLPEATILDNLSLFVSYESSNISLYDEEFISSSDVVTNINYAIPIILYNKSGLEGLGVEITGYESLLDPKLKGKIAFGSISSSSTYNHVENMLLAMGTGDDNDKKFESEDAWDYVESFLENLDGKDGIGSSAMLSGVQSGEYLVAMSYDTQGQIALQDPEDYDNVGVVFMTEGVVAKNSSAAVIKGGNEELAKKFVDWISSKKGQDILGLQAAGANPALKTAEVADYKVKLSDITVLPMDIQWSANKKSWVVEEFDKIYRRIFA